MQLQQWHKAILSVHAYRKTRRVHAYNDAGPVWCLPGQERGADGDHEEGHGCDGHPQQQLQQGNEQGEATATALVGILGRWASLLCFPPFLLLDGGRSSALLPSSRSIPSFLLPFFTFCLEMRLARILQLLGRLFSLSLFSLFSFPFLCQCLTVVLSVSVLPCSLPRPPFPSPLCSGFLSVLAQLGC